MRNATLEERPRWRFFRGGVDLERSFASLAKPAKPSRKLCQIDLHSVKSGFADDLLFLDVIEKRFSEAFASNKSELIFFLVERVFPRDFTQEMQIALVDVVVAIVEVKVYTAAAKAD